VTYGRSMQLDTRVEACRAEIGSCCLCSPYLITKC